MQYHRTNMLSIAGMLLAVAALVPGVTTAADAPMPTALQATRVEIQRSDVPGTELETRLYLITYPPGASARSAYGSDAPVTLVAGQSFHDLAVVPHTVFVNANPDKPLKFLVAYTVKKGAPVIEIP